MSIHQAFPLEWPAGYARTKYKQNGRFKTTVTRSRDFLKEEIRRLGGTHLVISTDIPLNNNGDLRADWARYKMESTGVAVYFKRKGEDVCLCCDSYEKIEHNLYAIGRTIEALRQIDRDGVSDFLNRAFTGFKALPETIVTPEPRIWYEVLEVPNNSDWEVVRKQYLKKSKETHPDIVGGSTQAFQEVTNAYSRAKLIYNQN